MSRFLKLFEGFGIELEYMIVDKKTLQILPITDRLMEAAQGTIVSDFEDGDITWSNELVGHVVELKTTGPATSLNHLETAFLRSLRKVQSLLEPMGATLLPSAMHPLMKPDEMTLWSHDNNEVYEAYDRIFDCRGHGWSNLQSMHINLPFSDDAEFERLHTAIRFLLPILPALTASSPMVEGRLTGALDNRLQYYQKNQIRVPSIAGNVIPELVTSMSDYREKILARVFNDIAPHDPDEILRDDWLNSRGAIARFGRQTIEIRVLDIQETPSMDIAIANLITSVLKELVTGKLVSHEAQRKQETLALKAIFDETAQHAEGAKIGDRNYLAAWGLNADVTAADLWKKIFATRDLPTYHAEKISLLLTRGSLATRISKALGQIPSVEDIRKTYLDLSSCLVKDQFFHGRESQ